eukprot:3523224-Rhodomonas_salina.1
MQALLNYESAPTSFPVNMLPPPSTGFPAWSRMVRHESSSVASPMLSLAFYYPANLASILMLPSSGNSAPSIPRPVAEPQNDNNLITILRQLSQSKISTAPASSTSMMPVPSAFVPNYFLSKTFPAQFSPREVSSPGTPETDASGETEISPSMSPINIVVLYPRKKRGLVNPSQDA